jgi:hypothetical protein
VHIRSLTFVLPLMPVDPWDQLPIRFPNSPSHHLLNKYVFQSNPSASIPRSKAHVPDDWDNDEEDNDDGTEDIPVSANRTLWENA